MTTSSQIVGSNFDPISPMNRFSRSPFDRLLVLPLLCGLAFTTNLYSQPSIELSAQSLDFGRVVVGEQTSADVSMINQGNSVLEISEIRSEGVTFDFELVAGAQYDVSPFEFVRTDLSHSILVESAQLDGSSLSVGSEIAVFTAGGVCAGVGEVDRAGVRIGFAAWGDDAESEQVEGFQEGEVFSFRYWDANSGRDIPASIEIIEGSDQFAANGVTVLRITGRVGVSVYDVSPFEYVRTDRSHSFVIDESLLDGEELNEGSTIGVFTPGNLCVGVGEVVRAGERLGFAAWGDDANSEILDGFRDGEAFAFRYWDAQSHREVAVTSEIISGAAEFVADGVTVLSLTGYLGSISLLPGSEATLRVSFRPETVAEYEGQLTLLSNDPGQESMTVELTGLGIEDEANLPAITIDPIEFDFGEVILGERRTTEIRIDNTGAGELLLGNITINNPNFTSEVIGVTAFDESPFSFSRTEVSHSLLITEALLGGEALSEGSEIGLFTSNGFCAGKVAIARVGERVGFAAWGDDANSDALDGFEEGEALNFRYWDAISGRVISVTSSIIDGPGVFTGNGVTVVNLTGHIDDPVYEESPFNFARTDVSHSLLIESALLEGEALAVGSEIGAFTANGLCAGIGLIAHAGERIGMSAWADDANSEIIDGFSSGQAISFRYWDTVSGREVTTEADFIEGPDRFAANAVTVVRLAGRLWQAKLNSGEGLFVAVNYSPDEAGIHEAEMTVESNDPERPSKHINLSGVGVEPYTPKPSLELSADDVDFGEVVVSETRTREITIHNGGDATLSIDAITSESDVFLVNFVGDRVYEESPFEVRRTDVSHSILIDSAILDGESLSANSEIGVFTPSGICAGLGLAVQAGERIGFAAWGDDPNSDAVDGFRDGEAFTFRYWDSASGREIAIESEIEQGLNAFTPNGVTVLRLVGNSGSARIEPGADITVTIEFIPTASGEFESRLMIESNDELAGDVFVGLNGIGIEPVEGEARISVEPDVLEFGEIFIDESSTEELIIRNTGDSPLILASMVTTDPAFSVNFVSGAEYDNSPFIFERSEASHSILIESALLGGEPLEVGSEIGIFTSGGICAGATAVVRTGERIGLAAWGDDANSDAIDGFVEGETLDYRYWDSVSGREVSALPEVVRGPEVFSANGLTIIRLNGEIGNEGRLEAGASLSVSVRFMPLTESEYQASLVITSNDPATPEASVELVGSGLVFHEPVPIIRIEEESIDFGDVEVGEHDFHSLSIWNDGNAPLIIEKVESDEPAFYVEFPGANVIEESPFEFARTNESHSILITEILLNGAPLGEGSEVGLFTPNGLCAGSEPVTEVGERLGVATWRDDPTTMAIDGFRENEEFAFRIWDNESKRLIEASAEFLQGPDTFRPEAVSVVVLTASFENMSVEPGEVYDMRVWFSPNEERQFEGNLTVTSNDLERSEVQISLSGAGVINNHNPEVIQPIDRFEADEDCGLVAIADLDNVFGDPDGDELIYHFEGAALLNLSIDDENILTINPIAEYSGENEVVVIAEDDPNREFVVRGQIGDGSADEELKAGPVADAPKHRQLRSTQAEATPGRDLVAGHRFIVAVLPVNDLPIITNPPIPVINADLNEGSLYRVRFEADDRDHHDSLQVWSIIGDDEGYSLSRNQDFSIVFEWTPEFGSARQAPYTPIVRVADPTGATDEVRLNLTVHHVELPPDVVNPIFPFTIDEDPAQAIQIADLDTVFVDPNGDALQFGFIATEALGMSIEAGNILTMRPVANFNSVRGEVVIVTARDAAEESTFAFRVTIRPVNDPPGAFDLLSPMNDEVIDSTHYNVAFRWQYAGNVDADRIDYLVKLRVRYEQLDTTLSVGPVLADSFRVNLGNILLALGLVHHRTSFDVGVTWSVTANDAEFTVASASQRRLVINSPVSVENDGVIAPKRLALAPAYPNPFNSSSMISFDLPAQSSVRLTICDQHGSTIASLLNGVLVAGKYSFAWDASGLPAGIYIASLEAMDARIVQKLVLIK